MKLNLQLCLLGGTVLYNLFTLSPSQAQITPDNSLSNNSKITNEGDVLIITGGTQAGNNLFHSFEQFSVLTGSTAYFNNTGEIQNIFSRVTGEAISNIDGLIRANGSTNLFLINPNGILFGSNAKLDIGGSFLSSTASSINFTDGFQFTVTPLQTSPLLTVSVPVGLRFGSNPGAIRVVGDGHDLTPGNYQPLNRGNSSKAGLQVQPGKTLALVGGNIDLEGSVLTAEGGRIELGGVAQGLVKLNSNSSGWDLDYTGVASFKDINLFQKALADASGTGSGSIQLQGRRLQLSDASLLLVQNQSAFPAGNIKVNASESLLIKGFDSSRKLSSGIWSESLASGNSGEILVSTPNLKLQSSGQIFSSTFGTADAANISLFIPKSLQIIGYHPNEVEGGVIVSSVSLGTGRAGDITISTGELNVTNGGVILTSSLSPLIPDTTLNGSGNININATNLVEVKGTAPDLYNNPSAISAATFSNASAGNVTINTSRLTVSNGGRVDSSTGAAGSAGSVTIKASDLVNVSGSSPSSENQSLLISSANIVGKDLQQFFKLPSIPSGKSGDVNIIAPILQITDGSQVTVRNDGTGDGGKILVDVNLLKLDNNGSITAATTSGEGGNISLKSQNLQLRNNSKITANAGRIGNGGNITIDTNILAALENSNITAKAFQGKGGNIQIDSQGLFISSKRQIDASSELGINGTIQIISPFLDFTKAATQPEAATQSPEIASVCQGHSDTAVSSLVNSGTGGIPASPNDPLNSTSGWYDNSVADQKLEDLQATTISADSETEPIIEAQGWKWNADGTLSMTLEPEEVEPYGSLTTPLCKELSHAQEIKD